MGSTVTGEEPGLLGFNGRRKGQECPKSTKHEMLRITGSAQALGESLPKQTGRTSCPYVGLMREMKVTRKAVCDDLQEKFTDDYPNP